MFGSSVAAFLATFWLLASMLLDIGTTSNLFRATLTLFMLATSYFLSSYSHLSSYACKTRDDRCLSMQTELDATKEDAAEERVSMQAKLDTKNVAEERESMQALRAELEKTELDKLRWRDLANDTKNRLKHERAGISIVVVVAAAAVVFS